jgi:hypothetical protein
MARQAISGEALRQVLVAETGRLLGVDAGHLRSKVRITRTSGQPNWNASIDVVGLNTVRAFNEALKRALAQYTVHPFL